MEKLIFKAVFEGVKIANVQLPLLPQRSLFAPVHCGLTGVLLGAVPVPHSLHRDSLPSRQSRSP